MYAMMSYLVEHGFRCSLYSVSPLISALSFLSLGLFVWSKDKHSLLNRLFMGFCIPTFWWQFSWFILFNFHNNHALASVMVKVGYTGITFITVTMLHFVTILLGFAVT